MIVMVCAFSSCSEKADDLVTPSLQNPIDASELNLSVVKNNAAADGSDYVELLFKAGPSVSKKFNEVTFSISPAGKFLNGATSQKVTLDVNGESRVFAVSTLPGVSTVTATVGGESKSAAVNFQTSWPQFIQIESDSSFLAPAAGIKTFVRAKLLRNPGIVTPGLTVRFYDSTAAGASVGIFLNTVPSNANGIASTEYYIQNLNFHGPVYIKGYVDTPGGRVAGVNSIVIR